MIDKIANSPNPSAMSARAELNSDIVTKMPTLSATRPSSRSARRCRRKYSA
jgi:hypothetical protein